MEEQQTIRSLAALAHAYRLRAYRLLVVAGNEGLTPGALMEALELPAATLSFHLKEMSGAGLITQERLGRNLIYRADFGHMNALLAYLSENCCQGEACLPSTTTACSRC
ncbi:helix-turn-helix transcriptional regulator [Pelomonas sp. V22]|uniref:ArsR/SmtB family transcription factor n=1 Tax=Pelomonas sp. V22 TaxID=2822139 RepID=UPI0024A93A23|nr:helix-turn-helix domain-containing protein [Pelomonas sp. V22]MDI4635344.1 helix-turn-helix transcriptional regulator [Pelomonas sp. V22]